MTDPAVEKPDHEIVTLLMTSVAEFKKSDLIYGYYRREYYAEGR